MTSQSPIEARRRIVLQLLRDGRIGPGARNDRSHPPVPAAPAPAATAVRQRADIRQPRI